MSDIEKIKQLREATGAGFKDCNLAVKESGGDLEKAVNLRKAGSSMLIVHENDFWDSILDLGYQE